MSTPSPAMQPRDAEGASLRLRGVTKAFGERLVIDRLDLDVGPGEFVTLIGPSGCGKSTLLRLVAGLVPPGSGELAVDGRPPAGARGSMAFVFQDATLLPWLTVRRNIGLLLRLRGVPAAAREAAVADLARLVGLSDSLDLYPRELSGGMRMRVSIARALALEPRLLLLDEPFGALDEMTRDRLNEELLRLRADHGWTALYVTHSVAEAVFLSSRVIVLSRNPGRIACEIAVPFAYPRPAELRESPSFLRLVAETSAALRAVAR